MATIGEERRGGRESRRKVRGSGVFPNVIHLRAFGEQLPLIFILSRWRMKALSLLATSD